MSDKPTRIWFDTEFIEDGVTIEPLSLGFVDDEDRRLYVVITDTDRSLADPWVAENVVPYLDVQPVGAECHRLPAADAGELIRQWCGSGPLEFWADFAAYDWVLLCRLFGRMIDLPHGWPMFVHDVQSIRRPGQRFPEGDGQDHNALDDAVTTRMRWRLASGVAS